MYVIRKTNQLEQMELGRVDCYPWGGEYRPEMLFRIGHTDEALLVNLLCYEAEPVVTARHRNGPVWDDSCMEFFVSPSADLSAGYFNFEINAQPTLLLHYGKDGAAAHRSPVDPEAWPTECFALQCVRGQDDFGRRYWRLSYRIPYALFRALCPPAELQDGATIRANLYRCGSNGQPAHYGCWSPIDSTVYPKPNFHVPEYFGDMQLE